MLCLNLQRQFTSCFKRDKISVGRNAISQAFPRSLSCYRKRIYCGKIKNMMIAANNVGIRKLQRYAGEEKNIVNKMQMGVDRQRTAYT